LKTLKLLAKSSQKLLRLEKEISSKDVEEIPKSITPGEWIVIIDEVTRKKYLSYMNPHSESFFNIKILKSYPIEWIPNESEAVIAISVLKEMIEIAIEKRKFFKSYQGGGRLIYGNADSVPGLIVDMYQKYILIQINAAGLDKYRESIREIFVKNFPDKKSILFDNLEYRKFELLPTYETEKVENDLEVVENGLKYLIQKNSIQKIGYYYDHRENRQKLLRKIEEINFKYKRGLDLFSYVGSWGMHLLKAGVEKVDFVDQGDMEKSININLKLNEFENRGTFIRKDVFKFLDEQNNIDEKYGVVVSDPPAFTKSEKNKHSAILGYEKLHQRALKLVEHNGLFVAASCTHYVDIEELDKTVQDAAFKNNLKVQMLDIGIQGHDHPITGFNDKSFYIKYLLYLVQRG
jgi:23S rRNA (cytosine1962-C5)-methyltransferase